LILIEKKRMATRQQTTTKKKAPRPINPLSLYVQQRGIVKFSDERQCFVRRIDVDPVRWTRVRGLRELLHEKFWPSYDFKRAHRVAKRLAGPGGLQSSGGNSGTGGNAHAGKIRGTVVHAQLEDLIELDDDAFAERHPKVHHWVAKVIRLVRSMGLRFVGAEEPVLAREGLLATACDQLCVDSEGRLVVLELKCGLADYGEHGNDSMKGRVINRILNNSPLNQALVQLLCTCMMLQDQYPAVTVHAAYVVRVNNTGARAHSLPVELLDRRDRLYEELLQYARATQEDKAVRQRRRRQLASRH
jgi:hypothetical protein